MKKIKIIANYLPQYHVIPENSKWWGEGYTDWCAVQGAKPLFKGHMQPRIPQNNHYYSLDNVNEIRWQANLAKKYGVYAFGFYHYWFSDKVNLLTKPAEIIKSNKDIDINFMFIWDNTSWVRSWSNIKAGNDWAPGFEDNFEYKNKSNSGILANLEYGSSEDWKTHFYYLLDFFKDDRYIKIDNKPMFGFFHPYKESHILAKMISLWDDLARQHGFNGILCLGKETWRPSNFEYKFRYSPFSPNYLSSSLKNKISYLISKKFNRIRFEDYDSHWRTIIAEAEKADEKTFLSGFVDFDDSPRRGNKARIIKGGTPEKFQKYIKELIDISIKQNKEYVFLTAWNEWGEGAYLEPDQYYGDSYLEALKSVLDS